MVALNDVKLRRNLFAKIFRKVDGDYNATLEKDGLTTYNVVYLTMMPEDAENNIAQS